MAKSNNIKSAIIDELSWNLRLEKKQVWSFTMPELSELQEMKDLIKSITRKENVPIKYHLEDNTNNRYVYILDIEEPMWAFVFKLSDDSWDYLEYLNELSEVI